MIKKFDKKYVFAKITYLHKQSNGHGGMAISRKIMLHAFSNKIKAMNYLDYVSKSKDYVDEKIITYQEALKIFGEKGIFEAIKMNERIENLNRYDCDML